MAHDPRFEVHAPGTTGESLIVGVANPGMAGVTAVDYLVDSLECEEVGHVTAEGFPSVVPFADGEPRHHTRLYDIPAANATVLASELLVPAGVSEAFADGLLDWTASDGVEEVVVLNGVPFPHGPDEHRVFHVSTAGFRERRLAGSPVDPLTGGFVDGVVGELLSNALGGGAPPTGVLLTPTHPPGPDLDAALLFLETLRSLYDLPVDPSALRERSEELKRFYSELAERAQNMQATEPREFSEDRAYM
jgi:uncharacterized protein